jgi:hypothetical protein
MPKASETRSISPNLTIILAPQQTPGMSESYAKVIGLHAADMGVLVTQERGWISLASGQC